MIFRRWLSLVVLCFVLSASVGACGGNATAPKATTSMAKTIPVTKAIETRLAKAPTPEVIPSPTPTVIPTQVSTIAPTPAMPAITTDQKVLLADLDFRYRRVTDSIVSVAKLFKQASDDPTLNGSHDWIVKVGNECGVWKAAYMTSKDFTAPPGLEIILAKWLDGIGKLNLAADDITSGLDANDNTIFARGVNEMLDGQQTLFAYNDLVSTFRRQHS